MNIRDELARLGVELTPQALQDILQYAANCAILLGGYCILDSGNGWEIEVEIDEDDEAFVMLVTYTLEDPDEEFN